MSKSNQVLATNLAPLVAFRFCCDVAIGLGLTIEDPNHQRLVIKQTMSPLITGPIITITIVLTQSVAGTEIRLEGANFGSGARESKRVEEFVDQFRRQLEVMAFETPQGAGDGSVPPQTSAAIQPPKRAFICVVGESEAELVAKRFARWIFILQTFMILVVPVIVLLLVPPELLEQLEWSALSEIAEGKQPRQPMDLPTDNAPLKVKLALALVSLRTFAGWLVFLFQYLFFGAYGFGWGAKK